MSPEPPGAKGTMMRMALVGKVSVCAAAGSGGEEREGEKAAARQRHAECVHGCEV